MWPPMWSLSRTSMTATFSSVGTVRRRFERRSGEIRVRRTAVMEDIVTGVAK